MKIQSVHVGLLVLTVLMAGCGQRDQGPQLMTVSGAVMVDGHPLSFGVINFDPSDGIAGSYGCEIRDGKYELKSAAGPKTVSIVASRPSKILGPDGKPSQEQYLPKKYNVKTELTATVKADEKNSFPFELSSK